jgi:hypothetical protein
MAWCGVRECTLQIPVFREEDIALDRFTSNSFDLVIEGESYRKRLEPTWKPTAPPDTPSTRRSLESTVDDVRAGGEPCARETPATVARDDGNDYRPGIMRSKTAKARTL